MPTPSDILITGLGVVSPLGVGLENFWKALAAGQSGVVERPEFAGHDWPFQIGAPVQGFDPKQLVKPRKALKVMCPPIQTGCAAANLAVEHAGLIPEQLNPDRIATVFGTEVFISDPREIGNAFFKCLVDGKYQHDRWGTAGLGEIEPLWMLKYLPNMVASHISIAIDARGPSNSICQGDASSLLSIIEAAELLRRGWADTAVAGGTGSNLQLFSMIYRGKDNYSRRVDKPAAASRPFDRNRDGEVAGEGAGAIVLETSNSMHKLDLPVGLKVSAHSSLRDFHNGWPRSASKHSPQHVCPWRSWGNSTHMEPANRSQTGSKQPRLPNSRPKFQWLLSNTILATSARAAGRSNSSAESWRCSGAFSRAQLISPPQTKDSR